MADILPHTKKTGSAAVQHEKHQPRPDNTPSETFWHRAKTQTQQTARQKIKQATAR